MTGSSEWNDDDDNDNTAVWQLCDGPSSRILTKPFRGNGFLLVIPNLNGQHCRCHLKVTWRRAGTDGQTLTWTESENNTKREVQHLLIFSQPRPPLLPLNSSIFHIFFTLQRINTSWTDGPAHPWNVKEHFLLIAQLTRARVRRKTRENFAHKFGAQFSVHLRRTVEWAVFLTKIHAKTHRRSTGKHANEALVKADA